MSDDGTEVLRDAIATVAGEGTFVTRYVVVAEVIDRDGDHAVHSISDCDLAYQTLGLLDHGRQLAIAHFHGWDDDE